MSTCYGYVRASTADQQSTLEVQQQSIEKYYEYREKPNGLTLGRVYVDRATSGKLFLARRPAGRDLSLIVQEGDVVVFHKLDRGFRNLEDLIRTVNEWTKEKVRCVFLDFNIDTGTPTGMLILHILGSVAEWERGRIAERTRECFALRKAKGLRIGPAPYGFRWTGQKGKRYLCINSGQRKLGQRIVHMRVVQQMTFNEIYLSLWKDGSRGAKGGHVGWGSIQKYYQSELRLQDWEDRQQKEPANGA